MLFSKEEYLKSIKTIKTLIRQEGLLLEEDLYMLNVENDVMKANALITIVYNKDNSDYGVKIMLPVKPEQMIDEIHFHDLHYNAWVALYKHLKKEYDKVKVNFQEVFYKIKNPEKPSDKVKDEDNLVSVITNDNLSHLADGLINGIITTTVGYHYTDGNVSGDVFSNNDEISQKLYEIQDHLELNRDFTKERKRFRPLVKKHTNSKNPIKSLRRK